MLTPKDLSQYPDGTWIETDIGMTTVIRTWPWNSPRPQGAAGETMNNKQTTDAATVEVLVNGTWTWYSQLDPDMGMNAEEFLASCRDLAPEEEMRIRQ